MLIIFKVHLHLIYYTTLSNFNLPTTMDLVEDDMRFMLIYEGALRVAVLVWPYVNIRTYEVEDAVIDQYFDVEYPGFDMDQTLVLARTLFSWWKALSTEREMEFPDEENFQRMYDVFVNLFGRLGIAYEIFNELVVPSNEAELELFDDMVTKYAEATNGLWQVIDDIKHIGGNRLVTNAWFEERIEIMREHDRERAHRVPVFEDNFNDSSSECSDVEPNDEDDMDIGY